MRLSAFGPEQIVHPGLKLPLVVAQPPSDHDAAIVILPDAARCVEIVLKTRRTCEGERPVTA
jgi:hypothetical protein